MICYLWVKTNRREGWYTRDSSEMITPHKEIKKVGVARTAIESWEVPDIIETFRLNDGKICEFKAVPIDERKGIPPC